MSRKREAQSEISADRSGRKRLRGLGVLLFVAIFLSLTASALGKEIHVLTEKSIGGGELSVQEDSGVALNQETGVLYVGDTGNGRVAEFESSTGAALGDLAAFTEPTAVAVDNSAGASKGDVYVVDAGNNSISKMTAAGVLVTGWATGGHLTGLGGIAGVAVGDSGELWVYSVAGLLRSFSPATGLQATECSTNTGGSSGGKVGSIAVDSTGRVYLLKGNEGQATGVNPTDCSSEWNWFSSAGLAVDEVDDSVFVSQYTVEQVGRDHNTIEENLGLSIRYNGLPRPSQLTVRSSTGEVFVVVTSESKVRTLAVENVEPPPVTIDPPTAVTGSTAKFSGTIDPGAPSGATLFAYESGWAFHCIPNCSGSLEGILAGDAGLTDVEGTAEELEPNTHYEVYLEGRNKGGVSRAPASTGISFTTNALPPTATEPFPLRVSDAEAVVAATITPGGAETSYEFEYVTLPEFEASGFAGAEKTAQSQVPAKVKSEEVSAEISGLQPETVYVFRVVAHNVVEGTPMTALSSAEEFTTYESSVSLSGCGNEPFRVGLAAFLPDCRAYEQATPVDKNGGSAEGIFEVVQAASDGSGITFYSEAGMPGGVGAQDFPSYAASREGGSWSTRGMLPPQAMGKEGGFLGATSNNRFALGWVRRYSESGHAETTLVDRDLRSGTNTQVAPYMNDCTVLEICSAFAGSSDDGEKLFIESYLPLTGETPPDQRNLYMWDEEAGTMTLVSLDEAGEPMPEGAMAGAYAWEEEFLQGGGALGRNFVDAIHAISADGSRAVFTEVGTGELFLRKGIGGPNPTTVNVSAPAPGSEEPGVRPAAFLEATPDGRYVFFKSPQRLTEDAGNGESFFSMNLYRYDVDTGTLVDLTPTTTDLETATGPAVAGLLGTSGDGKVAYFAARGRLATAASVEKNNLYRWDEDATPHISLVARLADTNGGPNDSSNWGAAQRRAGAGFDPKTARVAANGSVLVFASVSSLTGRRTESPECGSGEQEKCSEFYRYTANANQIECISCDPSGARPLGSATTITEMVNAVLLPKSSAGQPLPRNLSSDGNRFFFQTPDPLVARDTNSKAGCPKAGGIGDCQDVYEWEAAGSGSCHTAKANGGCIYLLSPGDSQEPSYLADVDPEGNNAFIFSNSQLVPADKDQLFDVYDVRVDGGLASQFAEAPSPCSSGEACQGQRAGSSPGATPGSSTFEGPGNEKKKKSPKACQKKGKKGKKKCKGSGKHKPHKKTTTHRGGAK